LRHSVPADSAATQIRRSSRRESLLMQPLFNRIALIGIGLIGSSISHAARRKGLAKTIVGHAHTAKTRETALRLGLVSEAYETAAEAARGADLVILCTPIGVCGSLTKEMQPHFAPGAILTDVGSVKAALHRDCSAYIPQGVHFIPAHPIAGTEHSGPEAGFASLFDNRWCVITPAKGANEAAVEKLRAFWQGLGSNVEIMDAEHHDMVLGITSHVPHVLAYTLVNTAAHLEKVTDSEVIKFSAGGFRDATRLAASDPTMWRDVFLNNKEAVLEMLGRYIEDLIMLQRDIRFGNGEAMFKLFTETRDIRRSIVQAGQDTSQSIDFYKTRATTGEPPAKS
jgi:cyclohexadieny/prephenate dehydrogenase